MRKSIIEDEGESRVTADEILERYRGGERLFENLELPDGLSFCGKTMPGVHFKDVWLSSADFSGADLTQTIFDTVNLKCADFRSADLRGATIKHCLICGAWFEGAKIDGITLEGTFFYGAAVDDLTAFAIEN